MAEQLRAPFPYPGGKSRVAEDAWRALGPDVVNYIEPFCATCAMLLLRPGGAGKIETVNDLDGGIINFWRAIKFAPYEVAEWCDWPVSELDLHARHAWLVARLEELADQLRADPHFYDAKAAGWWVWGICQWIGTGWCDLSKLERNAGSRPHVSGDNAGMGVLSPKLPNLSGYDTGVRQKKQMPELAISARANTTGKGVLSQQLPSLRVDSNATGNGIHASGLHQKMPSLALPGPGAGTEPGRGALSVSAQREYGLPAIGNDRGINGVAAPPCREWFQALAERLRRVRIVCGDWKRVLGNSVLGKGKNVGGRRPTGVFLDSPYDPNLRARNIYGHDAPGLSADVRDWAREHGKDPELRIIVCGYFEEHEELLSHGWKAHRWKGARGYAGEDNDNREQETLFLSPHCLPIERQRTLFGETA